MCTSSYVFKLSDEDKQFAQKYLNETDENRNQSIDEIKRWIVDNPQLNASTEDVSILAFLRGCKFNLERTKMKMGNFYKMRAEVPEWYANRSSRLPEVEELLTLGVFVPLRKLQDNKLVVIIRTAVHNPKKHKQDDVFKAGMMVLDAATKECEKVQIYGVTAIFDMKGIGLGHATQMTPSIIRKLVFAWQNYHCRPQQLEFINAPLYINVVLNIFKKFMSAKLRDRIRVHFGDTKKILEIVDKNILPEEYGGTDGCMEEHIERWVEKVKKQEEWFKYDEQFKSVLEK